MLYKTIDKTDLEVSAICLGGGSLCVVGEELSCNILDTYVGLGGIFIDTANIYGKWLPCGKNISEITIGKWMKKRGLRNKIIIGTKGGHPDLSDMSVGRLYKKDILSDLDESLMSLQTDYIDLYWLHRDDEKIPVDEIIEYLNDFVMMGKIRYFGCSNWKPHRIYEAFQYANRKGRRCFVANQMLWNLAKINKDPFDDKTLFFMDNDCYQLHKKMKFPAVPYSSQANGFFEKLDKQWNIPLKQELTRAYYNEENIKRLERIKILADQLSISITEIVLGYLISQPFTTIPIVGCRNLGQLRSSMKAGDLKLEEDSVKYLTGEW